MRVSDQGREQIARDEGGMRLHAYLDSRNIWTVGIGHNLEAKPIPHAAGVLIFEQDVADVEADLMRLVPWSATLSQPRYDVLANMTFNLGAGGFLTFVRMLRALEGGNYQMAADEMLASRWHTQVGSRAVRLAQQMAEDRWV